MVTNYMYNKWCDISGMGWTC